jgi:hypothetical protein
VARGHFATNITTKKILDVKYGGQLYSKIFVKFVEIGTIVRKLGDLKQKI